MGAPAVTTRAPARKRRPPAKPRPAAKARPATKPRPASKPRTRAAAAPRRLTPVAAVGRTAVAVGGIADSGFVIGMARSRVWIGVLGVLLGGIVAINVWGLGMSAGSSATAAKIDELQRSSSVYRARIASRSSNDVIEAAAAKLNLAVPAADGVNYIGAGDNDAERAAERLANGKIEVAPPAAPPTAEEEADAIAAEQAAAAAPVETTPVAPVAPVVDPAAAAIDPTTGLPLTP